MECTQRPEEEACKLLFSNSLDRADLITPTFTFIFKKGLQKL